MNQMRKALLARSFLIVVALLLLGEWFRSIELSSSPLQTVRAALIGAILSRSGQLSCGCILFFWIVTLKAINWSRLSGNNFAMKKSGFDVHEGFKTILVVFIVWTLALTWKRMPTVNSTENFILGIDQSTNMIVLLIGILISQIVGLVLNVCKSNGVSASRSIIIFLVFFLTIGSFLQAKAPAKFHYHGLARWHGLWANPNTYGLLMGTGFILACGLMVPLLSSAISNINGKQRLKTRLQCVGAIFAVLLTGTGLLFSFSRGAWLGTIAGLAVLAIHSEWASSVKATLWKTVRWALFTTAVLLFILAVFGGNHFKDPELRFVRRTLSIANVNDFSWRNRLEAWNGSLRMMADRPLAGFGWNQVEQMYDQFYRPPKVMEPMAIELNDYFSLAVTLGIPALFCFIIWMWHSLYPSKWGIAHETTEADWMPRVCRAAIVVLLIGFGFDGGLFKMALSVPFWILLEIVHESNSQMRLSALPKPETLRLKGPLIASAALAAGTLIFVMIWSGTTDPFRRINFSLSNIGKKVPGMVVLPKGSGPFPLAIYVHGAAKSMVASGESLRQIAEMGFACVSIEYDRTNQAEFNEQMRALCEYLSEQLWAKKQEMTWIGREQGAQWLLSFAFNNPELQPTLLVRINGGWVPELAKFNSDDSSLRIPLKSQILLLHEKKSRYFSADTVPELARVLRTHGVPVELLTISEETENNELLGIRVAAERCKSLLAPERPMVEASQNRPPNYWPLAIPGLVWLYIASAVTFRKIHKMPRPMPEGKQRPLVFVTSLLIAISLAAFAARFFVPRLVASSTAPGIVQRIFLSDTQKADFDYLSSPTLSGDKRMSSILQYLDIANNNRKLINWIVPEDQYRQFVLSPEINGDSTGDLQWSRPMWENFYPHIRKEKDPLSAARLVARFLRERVSVVNEPLGPVTINAMWNSGMADRSGFEILYVAALRSVGVAARLNATGNTELFFGDRWHQAPRPALMSWTSSDSDASIGAASPTSNQYLAE